MSGATHWTSLMNIVYSLTCAEGGKSSSQLTNNVKCNHYYRQCQMQPQPQVVSNTTTSTVSNAYTTTDSVKRIPFHKPCQMEPQTMSNPTTITTTNSQTQPHPKWSNATSSINSQTNHYHKRSSSILPPPSCSLPLI